MPFLLHRGVEHATQVPVEAREDLGAAVDQRRIDAETMEDVGEFDGDVSAAGDRDGPRQGLQVEGLVRGDAEFVAGQRGMRPGPTADGHEDRLGRHRLSACSQADGVAIDELGAAVDDFRAGFRQSLAVEPLQTRDLAVLVGDQRRPVEARFRRPSSHSRRHPRSARETARRRRRASSARSRGSRRFRRSGIPRRSRPSCRAKRPCALP